MNRTPYIDPGAIDEYNGVKPVSKIVPYKPPASKKPAAKKAAPKKKAK